MVFHPREGAASIDRRTVLRGGALVAAAALGGGALAACGSRPPRANSAPKLQLSRPDNPVTLPRYPELQPIADGMQPEKGATLRLYNYDEYISPDVTKAFGKKY